MTEKTDIPVARVENRGEKVGNPGAHLASEAYASIDKNTAEKKIDPANKVMDEFPKVKLMNGSSEYTGNNSNDFKVDNQAQKATSDARLMPGQNPSPQNQFPRDVGNNRGLGVRIQMPLAFDTDNKAASEGLSPGDAARNGAVLRANQDARNMEAPNPRQNLDLPGHQSQDLVGEKHQQQDIKGQRQADKPFNERDGNSGNAENAERAAGGNAADDAAKNGNADKDVRSARLALLKDAHVRDQAAGDKNFVDNFPGYQNKDREARAGDGQAPPNSPGSLDHLKADPKIHDQFKKVLEQMRMKELTNKDPKLVEQANQAIMDEKIRQIARTQKPNMSDYLKPRFRPEDLVKRQGPVFPGTDR